MYTDVYTFLDEQGNIKLLCNKGNGNTNKRILVYAAGGKVYFHYLKNSAYIVSTTSVSEDVISQQECMSLLEYIDTVINRMKLARDLSGCHITEYTARENRLSDDMELEKCTVNIEVDFTRGKAVLPPKTTKHITARWCQLVQGLSASEAIWASVRLKFLPRT